jgi:manganese transport protein
MPMLSTIKRKSRSVSLLGPAIVAGVAYLDPGNVATNLGAGAGYGYMLVWVIVSANLAAWLVQYLSSKLGLVTGMSIPSMIAYRFEKRPALRFAYWMQAEFVAMATDIAEIIGGAIALNLIFGLPLFVGGIITGVISMGLLAIQGRGFIRTFEFVIFGLVLITGAGFVAGLFITPPSADDIIGGLIPQFSDQESVLLAVGILGATIMPHAIYAHSSLSIDRFGLADSHSRLRQLIRATRWDVAIAMLIAGSINLILLGLGAETLFGHAMDDSIPGAFHAINSALGSGIGLLFGIALLASGLASTSVGTYAGSVIMAGLLKRKVSPLIRRLVTLIPALLVIASGVSPTQALIYSQVALSFGIPFAIFPLVRFTSDSRLMGKYRNHLATKIIGYALASALTLLNLFLIFLSA